MPAKVLLIPLIVAPIAFVVLYGLACMYRWRFKRRMRKMGIDIWR